MRSKLSVYSLAIFLSVLTFMSAPGLEAGGWGSTGEVVEHEGATWKGIYFDMNGLHLQAFLPNYCGTILQNNTVTLRGEVGDDADYVIISSLSSGFSPPNSLEGFVKLIRDANPDFIVDVVDAKKFGAKYAVDLVPANSDFTICWRFLSTNHRLIKMGTDDVNGSRRLFFFESIWIH